MPSAPVSRQAIALSCWSVEATSRIGRRGGVDAVQPCRGVEVVMVQPGAEDLRARGRLRHRVALPEPVHVDLRVLRRHAGVDELGRLVLRADESPAQRPRRRRRRPGGRRSRRRSRRSRCRCPASPRCPRPGVEVLRDQRERHPGDPASPHVREPVGHDLAPGRDRVALGRDRHLRAQRAGAGDPVDVDVQRLRDAGPGRVLQSRGGDVAALLPDRVRRAVDAQVDVEVARAGAPDGDRGREPARRVPARRDRGVDDPVRDPGDREPVAVARRDLDVGDRAAGEADALRGAASAPP